MRIAMNGNHAAGVFADALNKGLRFDVEKGFRGYEAYGDDRVHDPLVPGT